MKQEVFITGRGGGKTAFLIRYLEGRRDVLAKRVEWLQKMIFDYDAVIDDLKNRRTRLPKGVITMPRLSEVAATIEAEASFTTMPPEVRVRVKAPEPAWDGKAAIPHVTIAETAMRDTVFFLYGRRTGPGYTLSLKAPALTEDGQWIETRVRVMPRPDIPKDKVAASVQLACDRARKALHKAGTKVDFSLATEASS